MGGGGQILETSSGKENLFRAVGESTGREGCGSFLVCAHLRRLRGDRAGGRGQHLAGAVPRGCGIGSEAQRGRQESAGSWTFALASSSGLAHVRTCRV